MHFENMSLKREEETKVFNSRDVGVCWNWAKTYSFLIKEDKTVFRGKELLLMRLTKSDTYYKNQYPRALA